jgi:hypothetical protein
MPMKMKTLPTQRLNHRLNAALGARLPLMCAVDHVQGVRARSDIQQQSGKYEQAKIVRAEHIAPREIWELRLR